MRDIVVSLRCTQAVIAVLVLGGSGACSACGAVGGSGASPGEPTPAPTPSLAPAAAAPVFDVHEWGLVDVAPTAAALLAGPPGGPTNWDAPRRKPVLYFHLDPSTESLEAEVTVTVPAGAFVEHFPAGEVGADARSLAWRPLRVRAEGCHVTGAPTRDMPACQTSDGQCEAAEVATYEAADASCIAFGDAAYNHLFYRANGPPPTLPFDVAESGNDLVVTHARAADFAGPILYVQNAVGDVRVSVVAAPAMGASATLAPPTETDVTGALAAIRAAMRDAGLTPNEIEAFDRAWDNDLFGRAGAREVPARRASAGPQDYLLFPMPASLLDGTSHVSITPAPRALRRFILVRLAV